MNVSKFESKSAALMYKLLGGSDGPVKLITEKKIIIIMLQK